MYRLLYIVDDETFDQLDFLRRVKMSPNEPKSACPSPARYLSAFEAEVDNIYVVTLSGRLSGSYNSAEVARNMYMEDHPHKNIFVFDSCSASVGETLIGMKIRECEEAGLPFSEVVMETLRYRDSQQTFFVLESLETLRKNGRLSNFKAFIATALNIKPVCGSTPEGTIKQLDQARGMKKALEKMMQAIDSSVSDKVNRAVGISHCNNESRGLEVKRALEKKLGFKNVFLLNAHGVTSTYANQGGIVIAV